MKRIQTYKDFLADSTLNEAIMSVGPVKIDTSTADKFVDGVVKEMITPKIRKNFKDTTGLDIEGPLGEVVIFLKYQLKYINPVLYKKDLTQAEFDKMINDLISRTDTFIKGKAEELLKKMPFKIKAALSVIPESTLKKKIQDENGKEGLGIIEMILNYIGGIPEEQTFYGPDGKKQDPEKIIIPPNNLLIKANQTVSETWEPNAKKRSWLFGWWFSNNTWEGKKLVNHYIDLIVPILA
jgi:hypothetical protein